MKIDGAFNVFDKGQGIRAVLFTPHDLSGGSLGSHDVSSLEGLTHFMTVLGNPVQPEQAKLLWNGGSLAGSITPEHFGDYFSK